MKILIRLPNWLGDVVMSTAFVSAVRSNYPDALIDVIIKKELAGIASLIPGIVKIYPFSKNENKGLKGVLKYGFKLRDNQYDLFFNLPDSLSSKLLAWATGAGQRIGFNGEGGFLFLTKTFRKNKNVHRVEEYLSLLEKFTGKKFENQVVSLEVKKPGEPIKDWVIVNFNSEATSRKMPLEKAKAIVNKLTNHFPKAEFTFIGSAKEADFVNLIIENADNQERIKNFAGKTDLISLSHLLAACTVVLTTDSGPAHLANAFGIPVIVMFGAGNEFNTSPFNKQNLTVLRYGKLACEPCLDNKCKLYNEPKCMQMLDNEKIINALSFYLN